jgi:hypothetical protein
MLPRAVAHHLHHITEGALAVVVHQRFAGPVAALYAMQGIPMQQFSFVIYIDNSLHTEEVSCHMHRIALFGEHWRKQDRITQNQECECGSGNALSSVRTLPKQHGQGKQQGIFENAGEYGRRNNCGEDASQSSAGSDPQIVLRQVLRIGAPVRQCGVAQKTSGKQQREMDNDKNRVNREHYRNLHAHHRAEQDQNRQGQLSHTSR